MAKNKINNNEVSIVADIPIIDLGNGIAYSDTTTKKVYNPDICCKCGKNGTSRGVHGLIHGSAYVKHYCSPCYNEEYNPRRKINE